MILWIEKPQSIKIGKFEYMYCFSSFIWLKIFQSATTACSSSAYKAFKNNNTIAQAIESFNIWASCIRFNSTHVARMESNQIDKNRNSIPVFPVCYFAYGEKNEQNQWYKAPPHTLLIWVSETNSNWIFFRARHTILTCVCENNFDTESVINTVMKSMNEIELQKSIGCVLYPFERLLPFIFAYSWSNW